MKNKMQICISDNAGGIKKGVKFYIELSKKLEGINPSRYEDVD
jgi:hypothetical protein